MTRNLKKIALGIMSAGGILVPLAVVASCTPESKSEDFKITAITNPTVIETDIEGEAFKSLATLQKLFSGITQSDLNNIIVTKESVATNEYVIVLTANEGYTISGQSTLRSATITLSVKLPLELNIAAKTLMPNEIKAADVEGNAFKSYATLQKLFEFDTIVITEELLNRAVTVSMTPMTGDQPRVVTLTANNDFTINGAQSLESNSFTISFNVNYVIQKTATVPTNIKPSDIADDKYKMWPIVSRLFNGSGFGAGVLVNLDIRLITVVSGLTYQIELIPLTGFEINGESTGIISNEFTLSITNLDITAKSSDPQDITFKNLEDGAYIQSKAFLEKLFNIDAALTQTVIDNTINVEFSNITGDQYEIRLTTKSIDYNINGQTTIESNPFSTVINIDISALNPITQDISILDLVPGSTLESLNTLQKAFNIAADQGLIDLGLEVVLEDLANDRAIITLQRKTGYIINDGINNVESISSESFTKLMVITGSPRTAPLTSTKMTSDHVVANLHTFNTLNNFFEGITSEMINRDFTARLNNLETGFSTITLTANDKNLFSTGREITSIQFKYVDILNITSKNPISTPPTQNDLSAENLMSVTTLSKLFNNFTDADLEKVTVEFVLSGPVVWMVRLRATEWSIFKTGPSSTSTFIESLPFTPVN
ncbi:MAG: hypothetical protein ACRC7B_03010 [Metamycoplasmataceae bacterium]